jgi:hypothetical protein
MPCPCPGQDPGAPSTLRLAPEERHLLCNWFVIGGPGRDRTDDLFHAMEARSQLRHRPTLEEGTTSFIFDE